RFDAVWLAGPFLPFAVVPAAVQNSYAALHPGGWLLFGFFAGQKGALVEEVLRLRVIRTGGHPFMPGEAEELMVAAGFTGIRTVERTWTAPVGFVVGQRPCS
ncbi:MAG: hypothetical protein M3256_24015, partial [Actinomycetota bacterium]|nr:hypothetical protein [Actinomycetota bacterium]